MVLLAVTGGEGRRKNKEDERFCLHHIPFETEVIYLGGNITELGSGGKPKCRGGKAKL